MRELAVAILTSIALSSVGSLMPPADVTRSVIASPNGRFERIEWIDNDGWHLTVIDHHNGVVLVQQVTDDTGAAIGVGKLEDIERKGFRAALRSHGGFNEWDRQLSLYPRE